MRNVVLQVPDISCSHCERTILETLEDRPGVKAIKVDIPSKTVNLTYDDSALSLQQISTLLDDEGYPVAGVRPIG